MLPDLYILLFPQEDEEHSTSWGNRCTNLEAHSSKRLNPLCVIILVCLSNTWKSKTAGQTVLSLVILVKTFDSYWWIGSIASITSSNVYVKIINTTTQTKNQTVLWWLLWYQVTLYNSSIFGIPVSLSDLFIIKFWKFLAISFGWDCYDSKLLKIILSYLLKSVS